MNDRSDQLDLNETAQIVLNLSETQCELINTFKNEVNLYFKNKFKLNYALKKI